MESSKKYYWLKLKDNFFQQKEIKKLRKIAGGDTFTIIYLKLQLLSVKTDGILSYDSIEDSFADELALELDEDVENIKLTWSFLEKHGLIELLNDEKIYLPEVSKSIGQEGKSAERVRKYREKQNNQMLQCNTTVPKCNDNLLQCNTEIEIEKEIDIEIEKEIDKRDSKREKKTKPVKSAYGEFSHTLLTDLEYKKLIKTIGETNTIEYINKLDIYTASTGKKYKSHYVTILNWYRKDNPNVGNIQDIKNNNDYLDNAFEEAERLAQEERERNSKDEQ